MPGLKQILTEKYCSICNELKPIENFGIRNYKTYSQYRSDCKPCGALATKKYRDKNPEKVYESNKRYLSTRKDIAKKWNQDYIRRNIVRVRERARINQAKYKRDPVKKIIHNNRTRMGKIIKLQDAKKLATTVDLIGCTPDFLIAWLTHQFDSNMTIENYGSYWEMDHVTPCDCYDMEIESEQYECFNWRNIRPCEVSKNRSKNNEIIIHDILMQELKVNYYSNEVLCTTPE